MKTITINIDTATDIILNELQQRTGYSKDKIICDCVKGFVSEIMQGETIRQGKFEIEFN